MKYLTLIVLALVLTGCGTTTRVSAVIISHNSSGCFGGTSTTIKTEEGMMDMECGTWGNVGDEVTGYWTEGHFDAMHNGFKFKN